MRIQCVRGSVVGRDHAKRKSGWAGADAVQRGVQGAGGDRPGTSPVGVTSPPSCRPPADVAVPMALAPSIPPPVPRPPPTFPTKHRLRLRTALTASPVPSPRVPGLFSGRRRRRCGAPAGSPPPHEACRGFPGSRGRPFATLTPARRRKALAAVDRRVRLRKLFPTRPVKGDSRVVLDDDRGDR